MRWSPTLASSVSYSRWIGQNFCPSASLRFSACVSSSVLPVRRSDRMSSTYFSMSSATATVGTTSANNSGSRYHFLTLKPPGDRVLGAAGHYTRWLAGPKATRPPRTAAFVCVPPAPVDRARRLYCAVERREPVELPFQTEP